MAIAKHTLPKIHWRFPETAKFGRVIPKEKLYQQAGVNPPLKQLFTDQVSQIKWAYKLAENTINLAKTEQVDEIEVIQIKLKTGELDQQVLAAIDRAIPHPTLFVLHREKQDGTEIAYIAAHKQKVATKIKEKWQQSQYLQSEWLKSKDLENNPLPTATHLQGLYEQLLNAFIPAETLNTVSDIAGDYVIDTVQTTKAKTIDEKLADLAEIEALNKKIQQVKTKRDKEKQFNRRRELNDKFKALKQRVAKLQNG